MITPETIDRLLKEQHNKCWKCGRALYTDFHVHHGIFPKSHTNFKKYKKQLSMVENLFLVCPKCDLEHGYLSGYQMRCKGWADKVKLGYDMQVWIDSIGMIVPERFDE